MAEKPIYGQKNDLDSGDSYFYRFRNKLSFNVWKNAIASRIESGLENSKVFKNSKSTQIKKIADKPYQSKEVVQHGDGPNPNHIFVRINHPNKSPNSFTVVEFSKESFKSFKKEYGKQWGSFLKKIPPDHMDASASYFSNNTLKALNSNPHKLNTRIMASFKNWQHINPRSSHLVLLSGKYNKNLNVLSFNNKAKRDLFIKKISAIQLQNKKLAPGKKTPFLQATPISNFHPFVLDKAAKNQIFKGSMVDHFNHSKKMLQSLHHAKSDIISDTKLDMITHSAKINSEKSIANGEKPKPFVIKDKDLRNTTLQAHDLTHVTFQNCNFKGMDLSDVVLANKSLTKCNFSNTELSGANFSLSDINNCKFDHSYSKKNPVKFDNTTISNSSFSKSVLPEAQFYFSNIKQTDFSLSSLKESNFNSSKVQTSNFHRSNLHNSQFSTSNANISLAGTNFKGANIKGTKIVGTKFDPKLLAFQERKSISMTR